MAYPQCHFVCATYVLVNDLIREMDERYTGNANRASIDDHGHDSFLKSSAELPKSSRISYDAYNMWFSHALGR